MVAAGQDGTAAALGGERGQRLRLRGDLQEMQAGDVERADRATRRGGEVPQADEARFVRKWERAQEHGVEDTEDRAGTADAERKCQQRRRAESRVPPERADSESEIEEQRIHEFRNALPSELRATGNSSSLPAGVTG